MEADEIFYYFSIVATVACGIILSVLQYRRNGHNTNGEANHNSYFFKDSKVLKFKGVDILQAIKHARVFPVHPDRGWKLVDFCHSQRLWQRELTFEQTVITIHATYCKVRGSAQSVLGSLRDATKLPEWDPEVSDVKHVTEALDTNGNSGKSPAFYHEVITMDTNYVTNVLVGAVNQASQWLQGDVFVKKRKTLHRYCQREENNCGWLLELDEELNEWHFILVQPVDGIFENDQCLVTVLSSPNHSRGISARTLPALRLSCLQNYLQYRKMQVTPLITLSLPYENKDKDEFVKKPVSTGVNAGTPSLVKQEPGSKPNTIFNDIAKVMHDDPNKPDSTFLKRIKTLIDEKKVEYTERKRQQLIEKENKTFVDKETLDSQLIEDHAFQQRMIANQRSASFSLPHRIVEDTESSSDSSDSLEVIEGMEDPILPVKNDNEHNEIQDEKKVSEDNVASAGAKRAIFKFLRSSTVPEQLHQKIDSPVASRSSRWIEAIRKRAKSVDLTDGDKKDEALMTREREAEEQERAQEYTQDLKHKGRLAGAEILAEKMRVSGIAIGLPYEQQAARTGGWIYCGLERDVVILRKINESNSGLQCYLGKAVVPVPPKNVFEAIKNPHTRFTYDEMLKGINIVKDMGDGMKIVHMQHEVSQLFRKEQRDFCVLQHDKIEGGKYIISLVSVDCPDCPVQLDVIRAKMLASGWIIEPAMRDNKLHSMVTYIVKMELGHSKANTGYLVEELAAKQPLAIAFLKQYLQLPPGLQVEKSEKSALENYAKLQKDSLIRTATNNTENSANFNKDT